MRYREIIRLKDGRECVLRNAEEQDGQACLDNFILTHEQTDFLASYTDEIHFTVEQEADLMRSKAEDDGMVEILAEVEGKVAGLAGIDPLGKGEKICHRAGFGISIDREYWGLGLGRAMTQACIACAKKAGYAQLELDVVADNKRAIALYEEMGFTEYGRNPLGFKSRLTGWNELVLMRMDLRE
ncbi:MAG: GNAT family N-acetyltransferase [Lachnospiraceae bacterium]|nr:GNAT family N-acetyltransferase [Lachnospiraceae bacterium]